MASTPASPRPPELGLCEHLRARRLLLVLDNCEHVVEATVRLAEAVLTRCPDIAVLATSREVLGVPGGTAFPTVPAAVAAAVAIQVGRHRISSGPTEAINLLIKKIERTRLPQLR